MLGTNDTHDFTMFRHRTLRVYLKVQGHGKGPGPCWTFGTKYLVVYGQSAIDHDHEKIKLLRPHFVEPGDCLMNQNLSVLVKVNSQYYIWFR